MQPEKVEMVEDRSSKEWKTLRRGMKRGMRRMRRGMRRITRGMRRGMRRIRSR